MAVRKAARKGTHSDVSMDVHWVEARAATKDGPVVAWWADTSVAPRVVLRAVHWAVYWVGSTVAWDCSRAGKMVAQMVSCLAASWVATKAVRWADLVAARAVHWVVMSDGQLVVMSGYWWAGRSAETAEQKADCWV